MPGAPESLLTVDLVVVAMGYGYDPVFQTITGRSIIGGPDCDGNSAWTSSGLMAARSPRSPRGVPIGELAYARERRAQQATQPIGDRIWVAGDAVAGPSTVAEAMAHGFRVAGAILAYSETKSHLPSRYALPNRATKIGPSPDTISRQIGAHLHQAAWI